MVAKGIIDPAKVVRTALQDRLSVGRPSGHHRSHGRRNGEGAGHPVGRREAAAWVEWAAWGFKILLFPQKQMQKGRLRAAFFFGGCHTGLLY